MDIKVTAENKEDVKAKIKWACEQPQNMRFSAMLSAMKEKFGSTFSKAAISAARKAYFAGEKIVFVTTDVEEPEGEDGAQEEAQDETPEETGTRNVAQSFRDEKTHALKPVSADDLLDMNKRLKANKQRIEYGPLGWMVVQDDQPAEHVHS